MTKERNIRLYAVYFLLQILAFVVIFGGFYEYYIKTDTVDVWTYYIYNERLAWLVITILSVSMVTDFMAIQLSKYTKKKKMGILKFLIWEIVSSTIYALLFYYNAIDWVVLLIFDHYSLYGMMIVLFILRSFTHVGTMMIVNAVD